MRVLCFGTFDMLHMGHLRILQRARKLAEDSPDPFLAVGVSSDAFNRLKKGRAPIVPQEERMALVAALRGVDAVFLEESMELKERYIEAYQAQTVVMGSDWEGRMQLSVPLVTFPRTDGVSTTERLAAIRG